MRSENMDNKTKYIIAIIIIIVIIVVGAYFSGALTNKSQQEGSITVYAGAGFSEVGGDLVKAFNEKYPNIKVNMRYGGSGELYSTMETQKNGDVFLPAAYKYMGQAMENGYVKNDSVVNITKNVPVIVTQPGNPKNITSLSDLEKDDVKVALGEPEGPAIGKTSQSILEKNNISVTPTVTTTTVNQLVTYVVSGQVDASIVWEALTLWEDNKGKMEVVEIPANQNNISTIPVAVTTFTKNPDAANAFAEFLTSPDAKPIWEKWGYKME